MRTPIRVAFRGGLRDASNCVFEARAQPLVEWKSAVCDVARFASYVDSGTCRRIIRLAGLYPEEPGEMEDARAGRRNRVRWLPFDGETRWLTEMVARLFIKANQRYRFELTGLAEPLHVIEYGSSDHIDWHLDCGARETSTRKLVATILLSSPRSFTGGNIAFSAMDEPLKSDGIGEAIVFPAFLSHRVTPVRSGTRRILAAWAHGPAFR